METGGGVMEKGASLREKLETFTDCFFTEYHRSSRAMILFAVLFTVGTGRPSLLPSPTPSSSSPSAGLGV